VTEPVIIGSERSEVGLPAGMAVLMAGGSALDAVEAALRLCEDNLADLYVGTGGLPNARGEVELDASVMVGSTRAFGAVAALRGYPHPISVARALMERLPQHALLVGEGAELFADECGFGKAELLTDDARRKWRKALRKALSINGEFVDGENTQDGSGKIAYRLAALELVKRLAPHEGPWGTINVLALDASGELVAGVSTSGYPLKYPGRVGDSAIAGAGNYCDLRYGGAACTGRGELSIRATGARVVVDRLAAGDDPESACAAMLADAATLPDDFRAELRVLALTPDGRHGGASGQRGSTYCVMTGSDPQLRLARRRGLA
jgi:isoaspartyl peptidase/L-asparaginase-like protein (Ntn-hydrolase superfamily)